MGDLRDISRPAEAGAAPAPTRADGTGKAGMTGLDLVDIRDELDVVAHLYDAAQMAAETLQAGESEPIRAVMDHAAHKLFAAREKLEALAERQNGDAAPHASRDAPRVQRPVAAVSVRATTAAPGELFEQRFNAWLEARAELGRHELQPVAKVKEAERYERRHEALMQEVDDTARLAAATLATQPWMVWQKFEILEHALYDKGEEANFADRRHVWIVAGIKADLLALGFADMEVGRGAGDAGQEARS